MKFGNIILKTALILLLGIVMSIFALTSGSKAAPEETNELASATFMAGYYQWNLSNNLGEWFERYPNNPLNIPLLGADGVVHPDVFYFPEGKDGYKFWMYYTPYPPEGFEKPCLARSNDGIHFDTIGISNPLLTQTEPWENRHLADEDIVKAGDTWYLYYMGRNIYGTACIGVATSSDGIHWTKYSGNPVLVPTQSWELDWIGAPAAIYDGQKFWMWFCGGYTVGIELASSSDGIHWTRELGGSPVFAGTHGQWDADGVSHPNVISYHDTLWMYYWGYSGQQRFRLGLAKSVDKVHWVESRYNAVLDTIQHSWEGYHIYRSSPTMVGDTMYLYYSAYSDVVSIVPHIGLAKSYRYLDGDVDDDGNVDISDAVYLIAYIYGSGPTPKRVPACDDDCSGIIDIADVVYMLRYIFLGGPQPRFACR